MYFAEKKGSFYELPQGNNELRIFMQSTEGTNNTFDHIISSYSRQQKV